MELVAALSTALEGNFHSQGILQNLLSVYLTHAKNVAEAFIFTTSKNTASSCYTVRKPL